MPYTDPDKQELRQIEQARAHANWMLLRDFVDYGNSQAWPAQYIEQNRPALAVQRTIPGLLDRIEDGTLRYGTFKPAWLEWAEAVATELGVVTIQNGETITRETTFTLSADGDQQVEHGPWERAD